MKTNLKKMFGLVTLGMALLVNTVPTQAGMVYTAPDAQVSVSSTWASGQVAATRYSADATQHIGCATSRSATFSYLYCSATDKNGASLGCVSYDPQVIQMTNVMTDYSYLFFTTQSGSSLCSGVYVNNDSMHLK